MKFSDYNFSREIKQGLEQANFRRPTDIQYKSIPAIQNGEDVLGIAQTGTGKTAAFAIPLVDKLHKIKSSKRSEGIQCLIMVPTRELAVQIADVFQDLSRHTRVKTFALTGGLDQHPQISRLQKGIDILIATPGRMFDLASQGHLDLSTVKVLVLDEADHMLALGFYKDIQDLIEQLPKRRQTLFFSATIDREIKKLAYTLVTKPIRIQVSPKDPVSKNIDHSVSFIEMDDKRFFLERLIKNNPDKKILAFVRTRVRAERVQKAMERVNVESLNIHGDKEQTDRQQALNSFKKGEIKLLIATDVSARGIDIPGVDIVVNYDIPDVAENYVHRIGRTGRGKHRGLAISFCSKDEKEMLETIENYVSYKIKRTEIDKEEYNATVDTSEDMSKSLKEVMNEIQELQDWEKKKKGRKKNKKK